MTFGNGRKYWWSLLFQNMFIFLNLILKRLSIFVLPSNAVNGMGKNIFCCLCSIHYIMMLSFREQMCLGRQRFEKCFSQLRDLALPVPCISESCNEIKIKLNFYFHTSFWCLKRFYEGL